VAVLHRAHTSGFCSALEQLPHSVALLLSLSAAASSLASGISHYLREVKPSVLAMGTRRSLYWT